MVTKKRFSHRFVVLLVSVQFLVFVTFTIIFDNHGKIGSQVSTESSLRKEIFSLRETLDSVIADANSRTTSNQSNTISEGYGSLNVKIELIEHDLSVLKKQLTDFLVEANSNTEMPIAPLSNREQKRLREADYGQKLIQWKRQINDVYRSETEDTTWSIDTINAINTVLADTAIKPASINEIGCMETICKVNVAHTGQLQQSTFEAMFPALVAETLPSATMTTHTNDDGSITTVVYLMRNGYKLPPMQE